MTQKRTKPNRGSPNTRSRPKYPDLVPLSIVALDPGVTTGYAEFLYRGYPSVEVAQFKVNELEQDQFTGFDCMMAVIMQAGTAGYGNEPSPHPTIVYEQYIARPSRHGHLGGEAKRQFSPIAVIHEVIGFYKCLCREVSSENHEKLLEMPTFVPQQASEMGMMKDKRLKAMFPDLYAMTLSPAKPHARDALRHLLVYLRRKHPDHYRTLKLPETAD